ncbi:helix-turn-helix domain-containing protein [Saccharopolyspora hattusasensis]|uniref:helix-turn-helix domain-containing protein n=1 Tax=Saccharopolyspora hattusasensis TaxID=1128679 RepID=UPI003D96CCC6
MVAAVHGGMRQVEVARVFAVAPQSVSGWVQVWRKQGSKGQTRPARQLWCRFAGRPTWSAYLLRAA